MTIDDAIKYYSNKNVVLTEEEAEANTIALNTMRKYQMFQDQSLSLYMERLKADKDAVAKIIERLFTKDEVIAMLTEIQLEIEEQSLTHSEDNILSEWGLGYNHSVERCGEIIQQKINSLKENTYGTTSD